MVYQSQQILISGNTELDGRVPAKAESMEDKGFSKVLNSNMRSYELADRKTYPAKTPNSYASAGTQLINSRKYEPVKRADISAENVSGRAAGLSEEDAMGVEKAEADMEQTEELQSALDEVIVLLQELLTFAQNESVNESTSTNESMYTEGAKESPDLIATPDEVIGLVQGDAVKLTAKLKQKVNELLQIAQRLPDAKNPETVVQFAEKLMNLLGDEFTESTELIEQVNLKEPVNLKTLIEKMLSAANEAKTEITHETTVGENITPITDEILTQQTQKKPLQEQNPEVLKELKTETPITQEHESTVGSTDAKPKYSFEGSSHERTIIAASEKPEEQKIPQTAINPHMVEVSFTDFTEVSDNAPVKNGTIKEIVGTDAVVIQQVIEKAETLLGENRSEVVMQLKPESLGKISLRVIQERGEIVARFVAENEQVKAVLENNMQMLRDSLQRSGVLLQSLSVSVGHQNTGQNPGDNRSLQSEPEKRRHIKVAAPEVKADHLIYGQLGVTSGILGIGEPKINLTA